MELEFAARSSNWETLAGGCLMTVTSIVLSQAHSDGGKGFLPVEEEVQRVRKSPEWWFG